MSTHRLFLALWPTDEVRDALVRAQAAWVWPQQARLTCRARLHLTLHFIGDVPSERVGALEKDLAVPFEPFSLTLTRCELWHGGIAIYRPAEIPPMMEHLHRLLADALVSASLPVQPRPFRPHVTFARRAEGAALASMPEPVHWHARDGYRLVRSLPGGRGYESVAGFA